MALSFRNLRGPWPGFKTGRKREPIMVTAVYPGSFDPVTVGHVDIATRAASIFDKLVIAVYETPSKDLLFDAEERAQLMRKACGHLPNVEVIKFSGLVVRAAKDIGAGVIERHPEREGGDDP